MAKVREALENGEILSGRGLNQEIGLKRPEYIVEDGTTPEQKAEANGLLDLLQTFNFAFTLHLMKTILGVTNELSLVLQRKNQDIVNAMNQVKICKDRLQLMRDEGWDSLLGEVISFCTKEDIDIPDMDDVYILKGRSRRKAPTVTNLHHYKVDLFYSVVDMQLQEFNDRFPEVTTELLLCMECLNPDDCFATFNKQKLIRFAQFYPSEFSQVDLMALDNQLEIYIIDMRSSSDFANLENIGSLTEKLVETKRHVVYPLIYLLIKLALVLPVATAIVERAFSAMKFVKGRLRNWMGDNWMNDCLITYIEKDVFSSIDNELIIQRFQNMRTRLGQL